MSFQWFYWWIKRGRNTIHVIDALTVCQLRSLRSRNNWIWSSRFGQSKTPSNITAEKVCKKIYQILVKGKTSSPVKIQGNWLAEVDIFFKFTSELRVVSLFFLVRRAKRPRHANDHARDWRRETGEVRQKRDYPQSQREWSFTV